MRELRDGQRVRIVAEGTVTSGYADDTDSDVLMIQTEGGHFYIEVGGTIDAFVEIIKEPLPTEDGWYEAEAYPLSKGFFPYALIDGKWTDAKMNDLGTGQMLALMPLYRLGRVTE